jgi:hypothetical protein
MLALVGGSSIRAFSMSATFRRSPSFGSSG